MMLGHVTDLDKAILREVYEYVTGQGCDLG